MEFVRHFMLKTFLNLYVFVWKLRAKYGTVAKIENNILRPRGKKPELILPEINSNLGTEMLRRFNVTLDKNGDFDVLTNGTQVQFDFDSIFFTPNIQIVVLNYYGQLIAFNPTPLHLKYYVETKYLIIERVH